MQETNPPEGDDEKRSDKMPLEHIREIWMTDINDYYSIATAHYNDSQPDSFGQYLKIGPVWALRITLSSLSLLSSAKDKNDEMRNRYYNVDPDLTAALDYYQLCDRYLQSFETEGNPKNLAIVDSEYPEFIIFRKMMWGETNDSLIDLATGFVNLRKRQSEDVPGWENHVFLALYQSRFLQLVSGFLMIQSLPPLDDDYDE